MLAILNADFVAIGMSLCAMVSNFHVSESILLHAKLLEILCIRFFFTVQLGLTHSQSISLHNISSLCHSYGHSVKEHACNPYRN